MCTLNIVVVLHFTYCKGDTDVTQVHLYQEKGLCLIVMQQQ